MAKNKLQHHPTKTKVMIIGSSYNLNNKVYDYPVMLNSKVIPRTNSFECLGVLIIIIHFRTNEDQLQANVCKCIALRSCFKLKDDNSFTLVSTQTKIHKLILPLPSSLAC